MQIRLLPLLIAIPIGVLASCSDHSVPSTPELPVPKPLFPAPKPADALAAGKWYNCLLTTSGESSCWGFDSLGAFGDGRQAGSTKPVRTAAPPLVAISSADNSVCGLDASGRVWCWGSLPASMIVNSDIPIEQPAAPSPLVSITVGDIYVCGLDATGAAYCWGSNFFGQLGVGDFKGRTAPTRVAPGVRFTSITASLMVTCGLTTDGEGLCWGWNTFGGVGRGPPENAYVTSPTPVVGGHLFTSLKAGTTTTCGVVADGTAYCWGGNGSREVGQVDITGIDVPTAVATGVKFKSVFPGRANSTHQSTCGIALDDTAYCWGNNGDGQLGSSSGADCTDNGIAFQCRAAPEPVAGLERVEMITPGYNHTCAITLTKQVMCWGDNSRGELADGTFTSRSTPGPIQGSFSLP